MQKRSDVSIKHISCIFVKSVHRLLTGIPGYGKIHFGRTLWDIAMAIAVCRFSQPHVIISMETTIRMEHKMRQQTLNKNLNVPLYVQLKELILGDIQNGTLSAGDMIPTEHELMEQFSISRNVVRQAIGELVEGGYLIRKKAKGTFVSTPSANVEKISTLEVFRESALRSGAIPTTKVLSMEVLDADEESAQRLGIAPGVRITVLIMSGASSGFASRGRCSEIAEPEGRGQTPLRSCCSVNDFVMGSDPNGR